MHVISWQAGWVSDQQPDLNRAAKLTETIMLIALATFAKDSPRMSASMAGITACQYGSSAGEDWRARSLRPIEELIPAQDQHRMSPKMDDVVGYVSHEPSSPDNMRINILSKRTTQ
jgi:hypothetical protein